MIDKSNMRRRDAEAVAGAYEHVRLYAERLAMDEADWYTVVELAANLCEAANRLATLMRRCQVDTVAYCYGKTRICLNDGSVLIV